MLVGEEKSFGGVMFGKELAPQGREGRVVGTLEQNMDSAPGSPVEGRDE